MLNSVRGTLSEKNIDSVCVLSSGGIEWEIAVPGIDIGRLPPLGEETRIYTWLYHKEDQMKLFGFSDPERRNVFLELLKVEGIGPRGALRIMGGIASEDLENALESEDLARLEAVPGLGKKTAQKMILALKGKLVTSKPAEHTPYGELAEALVGMGYERKLAIEALNRANSAADANITGAEREKFLFKEAIVTLSGT